MQFVTQVCDRCEANYPLTPRAAGERPVRPLQIKWPNGMESKIELCNPCQTVFDRWYFDKFKKGET